MPSIHYVSLTYLAFLSITPIIHAIFRITGEDEQVEKIKKEYLSMLKSQEFEIEGKKTKLYPIINRRGKSVNYTKEEVAKDFDVEAKYAIFFSSFKMLFQILLINSGYLIVFFTGHWIGLVISTITFAVVCYQTDQSLEDYETPDGSIYDMLLTIAGVAIYMAPIILHALFGGV